MTAFANSFYRDLTCALAATLITAVLGLSFLSSTGRAPGAWRTAAPSRCRPSPVGSASPNRPFW